MLHYFVSKLSYFSIKSKGVKLIKFFIFLYYLTDNKNLKMTCLKRSK